MKGQIMTQAYNVILPSKIKELAFDTRESMGETKNNYAKVLRQNHYTLHYTIHIKLENMQTNLQLKL